MPNRQLVERGERYRDEARAARKRLVELRRAKDEARQLEDFDLVAEFELKERTAEQELERVRALQQNSLNQLAGLTVQSDVDLLSDPEQERRLSAAAYSKQPFGSEILGTIPLATVSLAQPQPVAASSLAAAGRADAIGGISTFAAAGEVEVPATGRRGPPGQIAIAPRTIPLNLLMLIPTGEMDFQSYVYLRQQGGQFDTNVGEVAEATVKPQGEVTFLEETVEAKTIATFTKIRRQALDDIAEMASVINSDLAYRVQRRLVKEIVNGSGEGENIRGIMNTTGIGVVTFTAGAQGSDQIAQGQEVIELSGTNATGVVLNPTDYRKMLVAKSSGSGEYLNSAGMFAAPGDMGWGMPIIRTAAVPPGTALVADWQNSMRLMYREGVNVRASDSDQDDFVRNAVTILAECRVALAIVAPTLICAVHLE